MSVDSYSYLGYGLIYKLEDLTSLRALLRPEDKGILSPANMVPGGGIFMEVMEALYRGVLSTSLPNLRVEVSQDGSGYSFPVTLVITAKSTVKQIDFSEENFEAMGFNDFPKPTEKEMEEFASLAEMGGAKPNQNPNYVIWGMVY